MHNHQKQLDFVKQYITKPEIIFLKSDMSPRSYYRVHDTNNNQSFVLMDADLSANLKPFIQLSHYLNDQKVRAPKVIEQDLENGFLLLEDFGDNTLTKIFQTNHSLQVEQNLFEKSFDILHRIYEKSAENFIKNLVPDYSLDLYIKEVNVFIEYYFKYCRAQDISQDLAEIWKDLWTSALNSVDGLTPPTLVLRDYHVDNLMLLNNNDLGVLDFQDGVYGSVMYDYISLIEDARRDLDPELKKHLTKYFFKIFDTKYHQDYLHTADILGAGRHAKILGVFTRYAILHNNPEKLCHLPRTIKLLTEALKRSELKEIQYFIKDQGLCVPNLK
jgi:aminoglycoside/choline kinase family phosphotransferase